MRIGILGATGPAGGGLAARLASVGHEVLFGSRAVDKARSAVDELEKEWGDRVAGRLIACDNAWACDAPVTTTTRPLRSGAVVAATVRCA